MIESVLQSLASGLPVLVMQFIAAAGVYGAGIAVYLRLTPYHELDLVRGGNVAAAITLGGALIGLAIPIGMTLAHSLNVADILIWGSVSAALQAIAFGAANLALRGLARSVERGDVAAAIVAASVQIAVGIINAGAMAT
jgi:putative membrane protein